MNIECNHCKNKERDDIVCYKNDRNECVVSKVPTEFRCVNCGCPKPITAAYTPKNPKKPNCRCDCHVEKERSCGM